MIQLDKILFPTDLSEYSESALAYATELASTFGAKVYLLHVLEPYWLEAVATIQFPGHSANTLHQSWKASNERLKKLQASMEGIEVEIVEVQGTPHVEIVHLARKEKIDLIVLATHGRSGISHALIGSVAEKVVKMAPCPVLTVKHPEHEFVMP